MEKILVPDIVLITYDWDGPKYILCTRIYLLKSSFLQFGQFPAKKKKSDPSYVNTLTEVYNGHTLELSYYNQNL